MILWNISRISDQTNSNQNNWIAMREYLVLYPSYVLLISSLMRCVIIDILINICVLPSGVSSSYVHINQYVLIFFFFCIVFSCSLFICWFCFFYLQNQNVEFTCCVWLCCCALTNTYYFFCCCWGLKVKNENR